MCVVGFGVVHGDFVWVCALGGVVSGWGVLLALAFVLQPVRVCGVGWRW